MAFDDNNRPPRLVRSVAAPLVLIALWVAVIVWAWGYNATARQVPLLVGGTMLVLSLIDFITRFDVPRLRLLRDFWGADFRHREMQHNPPVVAELLQAAWMIGCVAAMLSIGILPAVPIFVFCYMTLHGRRRLVEAAAAAAIVFGFVYLVFEVLLEYRLYRGVLFDPRGFTAW